jgi:sugar (pentulose or hexulose) kinase
MAGKILGLDIGAGSVKAVILSQGFRRAHRREASRRRWRSFLRIRSFVGRSA